MSTIPTPPPSTLSVPSDTELDNNTSTTMPPHRPIYLIVATALNPPMGIGLHGSLPWPALKKDMGFFRRVTSNAPKSEGVARRNAVVMGRKTWESIPVKFRPLKERLNVVVTRGVESFREGNGREVLAVGGLRDGLDVLSTREDVSGVFIIGGSQIYEEAVKQSFEGGQLRILQTKVRKKDGGEIECDAFFPVKLDEEVQGWRMVGRKEVEGWVDGETVPGADGWEDDGESGMEIRVVGWERRDV